MEPSPVAKAAAVVAAGADRAEQVLMVVPTTDTNRPVHMETGSAPTGVCVDTGDNVAGEEEELSGGRDRLAVGGQAGGRGKATTGGDGPGQHKMDLNLR